MAVVTTQFQQGQEHLVKGLLEAQALPLVDMVLEVEVEAALLEIMELLAGQEMEAQDKC